MAMQAKDGRAVVGYLRVSTEEQAENGYGLGAQEAKVRAYASALGLPLAEIIQDDGYSGGTLDRPGLQALLGRIAAGEVGVVVIAKLDRLSRSLRNLLNLYGDAFEAHNVALVSVGENFDTSTASGKLFFQMVGSFAEFERTMIMERTSGGRKQKAAQGGYAGGRPAFGYVAAKAAHALEVDEGAAETVRYIFSLAAQGLSQKDVAARLNAEGRATQQGAMWHQAQVGRVLARRGTYEGGYAYAGVVAAKGEQAPII